MTVTRALQGHCGSFSSCKTSICYSTIVSPIPLSSGGRNSPGETPLTKVIPIAEPKIPLPITTHQQRENQKNKSKAAAAAQPHLGRSAGLHNPGVAFLLLIPTWKLRAHLSSFLSHIELHPTVTRVCWQHRWHAQKGVSHSSSLQIMRTAKRTLFSEQRTKC